MNEIGPEEVQSVAQPLPQNPNAPVQAQPKKIQYNGPGFLMSVLGGALSGISGTTSPQQAYAMGLPKSAAFLPLNVVANMAEELRNAPERQAYLDYLKAGTQNRLEGPSGHFQLTQEAYDNLPKSIKPYYKVGDYAPNKIRETLPKESPTAGKEAKRSEWMKTISDYAAKMNVSMDALRPGGMGGWNDNNLEMVATTIKDHPSYNMQDLKLGYAGKLAGATSAARDIADVKVNLNSAHSGLVKVLNEAKVIADRMGQGKLAAFNKLYQAGSRQFNDTDARKLATALDLAGGNYARIKKRGKASIGQEEEKSAAKILSDELSSNGIEAVKNMAELEYQGSLQGLTSGNPQQESSGPYGPTTVRNGKTYIWNPQTGKYHPQGQ